MSVADMFRDFIDNLAIQNGETISNRYGELTAALNKRFRDTESKTANTLQVGSFGRKTAIDGISDLDMLYMMPKSEWETYKDSKQRKLLEDVKAAIKSRYPNTDVRVDRLVVTVTYTDFHVEVQPVFEEEDKSFKYPDTKGDGSWRITNPRPEMNEISEMDGRKNSNLRKLCKMVRAWRNEQGLEMGGLLIDTLSYNFLKTTTEYDNSSYLYYDNLSRDFFKYLSELPEQNEYAAPGSGQRVKVKAKFQPRAKKAYQLCLEAIDAEGTKGVNDKWKNVYGRPFPNYVEPVRESALERKQRTWDDTEEFIENYYPVDIKHTMRIDCEVKQNGYREHFLREMLFRRILLRTKKSLKFTISKITVPEPYEIKWKVLNRGEVAQQRNCIRGEIVTDNGGREKIESTDFRGEHRVECYAIKDGVVVARDQILVPISST